jgi:hypothetical protein
MPAADQSISEQTAVMHRTCPVCQEINARIHPHTKELSVIANKGTQLAREHRQHSEFEGLLARSQHLRSEISTLEMERKLHEQNHTWRTYPGD